MIRQLLFLLLPILATGCLEDDGFTLEKLERLSGEVSALRVEVSALSAENSKLRARLLGYEPWKGRVQLNPVGRSGDGRTFIQICPEGTFMIGARGYAGSLIDQLTVVCAAVGTDDTVRSTIELEPAGHVGGRRYEQLCPPRTAVKGIRGGAGDAVDSVTLQCDTVGALQPMPTSSTPYDPEDEVVEEPAPEKAPSAQPKRRAPPRTQTLGRIGGTGGRAYRRRCPGKSFAIGFTGRAESTLKTLVLHCVDPPRPAPKKVEPKRQAPTPQPAEKAEPTGAAEKGKKTEK